MDCTITAHNSIIIDRMIQVIKTPTISIDTMHAVCIQVVSTDKTAILEFTLANCMFEDLALKNKHVSIPRQRFYMKKMKHLRITTNEYVMVFEYVFEGYVFRRSVFHACAQPFEIGSEPRMYATDLDPGMMKTMCKEIQNEKVEVRISNGMGEVSGNKSRVRFRLDCADEWKAKGIGRNLRNIFEISDLFCAMKMEYGPQSSSMKIVLVGDEIKASFFTAVCISSKADEF
ncbi:hypothetical protein HK407_09g13700 [Ordospora pajunii]|uniref:uncharacterized protein n=1 Tax=Ordospora pajunii TaxID=3039483 RepID=UPI00295287B8|nr:uncharacterized protein HK407_09g13700 [Ordospora pajunii]KAH9410957.1 hypothetical protein HK407_09g13700 [Ordospora pajunii]